MTVVHRSLQMVLATAALCAASPAWGGSFVNLDTQLPNAGNAALAGAGSATRQGVEAASQNPAAMGALDEAWLGLSGGTGGLAADGSSDAEVVWPVQDDLTLGLANDAFFGRGGSGYGEYESSISASLAATESLYLGVRLLDQQAYNLGRAVTGGQDTSVDAGARWTPYEDRTQQLVLGWWGSQLASSWPSRYWYSAVPITQRLGLAWTLKRRMELDVEFDDPQYAASTLNQQVRRVGASWLGWSRVQVSAGIALSAADELPLLSAGASAPFWLWGLQGNLRYAVTGQDQGKDIRHRVAVEIGLPAFRRSAIVAVPLNVVYEPGTKKVKSATISLSVAGDKASAKEWELEIRDRSGNLVRVMKGSGTPPAFVTWDGKDALGEAVSQADQVSYRLNLKTSSGVLSSKEAFSLEASASLSGMEALSGPPGAQAMVIPVTDKDGTIVRLRLRPPAMPGDVQRWEILIQNADGGTLHSIEGQGPFPQEVDWDGKDAAGRRLLDAKGLKIRFNAFDGSGRLSSVDQPLDNGLQPVEEPEAPLQRLGLKEPAFREGGPQLAMYLSDRYLLRLPEFAGEQVPQEPPTLTPTLSPTPVPPASPTPTRTPTATPTPTEVPAWFPVVPETATPGPLPAASPTGTPLPAPSPIPRRTPAPLPRRSPTAWPTWPPTPVPTEIPTLAPPPTEAVPAGIKAQPTAEPKALAAGLSTARFMSNLDDLPPAMMTRDQAAALGPQQPSHGHHGHRTLLPSTIDGVLDVFQMNSAVVDESRYADKLEAFYWRLKAYRNRRLLLTGLIMHGEKGGEELSRQRVRELSQRLVEEGDFEGEFILKVDGNPGDRKGVLIEVLNR